MIYTTGYYGHQPEALKSLAAAAEHASPWFVGPYGFVLTDAKPLPFVPLTGQLGFFAVPQREGAHA